MAKHRYTTVKVEVALFRKAQRAGRLQRPTATGQGMVNVLLERALADMSAASKQSNPTT